MLTSQERPFERIALAERAWQSGNSSDAERLFREGISAYRLTEPNGLDFALGRYGAFLIAQQRTDEAATILKQAIDQGTDLPTVWSDYIQIVADRHDLDDFKRAIEQMASSGKNRVETAFILRHARRAYQQGATGFAQNIAGWVIDRSTRIGDSAGRWAAIGDLGRFLERDGQLEKALQLWRNAFEEGGSDSETIDRLSMHLEHAKDYQGSMAVIREALQRRLPANAEEALRKRLIRCEAKASNQSRPNTGKGPDVPAYSIRIASSSFEPIFQIRFKSSVRKVAIIGNVCRCLVPSSRSSMLVDVDLRSGSALKQIGNLPVLGDICFASEGNAIGMLRTAAVGKGPTLLTFLNADGSVVAQSSVPDATSDVAEGPGLWYVGCRNGVLYGFGFDGTQRWTWEVPSENESEDKALRKPLGTDINNAYLRPCPYFVASHGSLAAVASWANIYAISPDGRTRWRTELPDEQQRRWQFTVPIPGAPTAAHVDNAPPGLTLTMQIQGSGPLVSFIAANSDGIIVGSSQGRIYRFDLNGALHQVKVIGHGQVRASIRPDGKIGAAWCNGRLLCVDDDNIVDIGNNVESPTGLATFGSDLVLWKRGEIKLLNREGHLLWSVEFSKSVTDVLAYGDTLVCAAGVLAAFRPSGR